MKRKWTVLAVAGMLIIGIAVLLYPALSSAVNRQHGSFAIQQKQQQLDNMDSEQMEAALAEAREYNDQLIHDATPDESQYEQILNFGSGIMGYITVEKLDLKLPIYHGVGTDTLEKGVGHLPSSAFPIGGTGNHTVLTGHTGLPSAKLFTDLVELTEGDRFQVTVGTHRVEYQVDQILVVLPQETEELMPVSGQDYCTLVTCTPYGVNSHRLFVRGSRVEQTEEATTPTDTAPEPKQGKNWLWILFVPLFVLLLIWKRKKGSYD